MFSLLLIFKINAYSENTHICDNSHKFWKICIYIKGFIIYMYDAVKPVGTYFFQESLLTTDKKKKFVFSPDYRSLKHYFIWYHWYDRMVCKICIYFKAKTRFQRNCVGIWDKCLDFLASQAFKFILLCKKIFWLKS